MMRWKLLSGPPPWTAILLLLASGNAVASVEPLTPHEAVELALSNHPALEAADYAVSGAEAERSVARSGYRPRVDLTNDFARSTNPTYVFSSKLGQEQFGVEDFNPETLNNPDPFTNSQWRISLRQSIWNGGGDQQRSKASKHGIEAAEAGRARVRNEVAFGALRGFWDAVVADEMLAVAQRAELAAEANFELVDEQLQAGLAVPSDRMSAEVRLADVRAQRIRAEQGRRVARAALRRALGVGDDREFLLEPPRVRPGEPDGELEQEVIAALSGRSDLKALQAREAQAAAGSRVADSAHWPRLGFGAMYEANDENLFGASGTNWTVGLSLRWTLYGGSEVGSRKAVANAQRSRLKAMQRELADGIRLEVASAWADYHSAAQRLQVAESSLELAGEALRIVRERYAEGMAVIVELLGAEAALTQAEGNRVQAGRDLALAAAALDLAIGTDVASATLDTTAQEHKDGMP